MAKQPYLTDSELKARRGEVPGLNGLRAASILIVIISHMNLERYIPGGFGVGVFLFISGFLITRLLLAEASEYGGIDLKAFWLRRIIRLYPPLLAMIALAVSWSLVRGESVSLVGVLSTLFYFANYLRIFDPEALATMHMSHTWSLSVEEHFYLVYPILMIVLIRVPRLIPHVLLLGCAIALALRIFYSWAIPDIASSYVYNATETRMDFILAGALAAAICNSRHGQRFLDLVCRPWVLALGIGLILFSLAWRDPFFRDTFRGSVQILALFLIVPGLIFRDHMLFAKTVLNSPFFDWIGRISYDLYLYHAPVFGITLELVRGKNAASLPIEIAGYVVAIILSVIVAQLSYSYIERPLKPLRARLRRPVRAEDGTGGRETPSDATPAGQVAA